MKRTLVLLVGTLLALPVCLLTAANPMANTAFAATTTAPTVLSNAREEEATLTIKEIMKLAHKDGLLKKVATDKASDEEKATLHGYYEQMKDLPPPQGDQTSWDEKTLALVDASQAAIDGDAVAASKLKSATKCAACHDVHK